MSYNICPPYTPEPFLPFGMIDPMWVSYGAEGEKTVYISSKPAVLPNGQPVSRMPSVIYLRSKPLLYYPTKISIEAWTRARYSRDSRRHGHNLLQKTPHVAIVVEPPTTNATNAALVTKRAIDILDNGGSLNQGKREFIVKEDHELLEALVPGSIVRVVLVCSPGDQCQCKRAVMTIHWSMGGRERYPMAIVRENLLRQPLQQHQQQHQQDEPEESSEKYRLLSFVFKEAPKDVFSNIAQFAFV